MRRADPVVVAAVTIVVAACAPPRKDLVPKPPDAPPASAAPRANLDPPATRPRADGAAAAGFVAGIPLDQPASALLAAIAAPDVAGRRLRVPVQVEVVLHMVRQVRLGFAADAPVLPVDDSRLGIGLADRARQRCGDRRPCALWLVGAWETTLTGEPRFVVREVGDAIGPDEATRITHVLVEPRG